MLLNMVGYILNGALTTLAVTGIALPMGFALGLLLALARVYGRTVVSRFATFYSIVMRGVPPVVLLFTLYFVIAGTVNISPFWAGSVSLGIISSAYQLEVFRGAILSVGQGQMMAARAIGMSRVKAIRYVVLPQAFRVVIPPWSNEAATVLKDSSLVYALGVTEVLRRAQFMSARTHQPFLAFGVAAAIYFLLTFITNRLLDSVERRVRIPSH